ncbi:hypothetical protein ABIA00_000210 [Bradyrhizobium ottawaense]|uniref:hypothetical protein n=1 Tax=Bradyrhizobium ottawaense TaxID=931866 RepID=UPI003837C36D
MGRLQVHARSLVGAVEATPASPEHEPFGAPAQPDLAPILDRSLAFSVRSEDAMPNRIPLDPKLPKAFDATPNEARSKAQLDQWWDRPYGLTRPDGRIEVRCLNGGAWDRSTHLGIADDYDAACALAEAKQAEWLRFREQPCTCLDEGRVTVVRQPQRPDEEMLELTSFSTAEAATEYLRANFPEPSSSR